MLSKIKSEIDSFTKTIKEIEGCDKMLNYVNSDIYSSIKLLMFASKTFTVYGKIMLFFIISLTGLFVISSITISKVNLGLLAIDLVLFVLTLVYIMHFKNFLIMSIKKSKDDMKKSEN